VFAVGIWIFQGGGERPSAISTTSSSLSNQTLPTSTTTSPALLPDTPWTLIFDDGLEGVVVLDPNHPVGQTSELEGQRPGDQPYRLELVDSHLIVGWEQVHAVDIRSGESTVIGEATIFVPAAESDRVWLIDYAGGRIGQGAVQVWQVSVSGEVLTPPVLIETDGFPAIGVPGGLVIESGSGISIWDPTLAEVVEMGSGPGFVSDVTVGHGSALAWCSDLCDEFHVTEVTSGADQVFIHPELSSPFLGRWARFSGDGRYLAAPTEVGDIVIFDRETGASEVAFSLPNSNFAKLEWAPSGYELFASVSNQDGLSTTMAYYRLGAGRPDTFQVSLALRFDFVVVTEEEAQSFLATSTG